MAVAGAGARPCRPPGPSRPPCIIAGARGPLVEEEETLYNLKVEKEAQVLQELEREKGIFEEEVRRSNTADPGQLCATPYGIDVVGITEFVALTGALVGGECRSTAGRSLQRSADHSGARRPSTRPAGAQPV